MKLLNGALMMLTSLAMVACDGALSEADMDSIFMSDDDRQATTLDPSLGNQYSTPTAKGPYTPTCRHIDNPNVNVTFCTDDLMVPVECTQEAVNYYSTEEGVNRCMLLRNSGNPTITNDNLICCHYPWSET